MLSFHKSNLVGCALLLGITLAPKSVSALSFGVGPIAGFNFANAEVDDHAQTDGRSGIALGARTEFGVTKPYSLVVEGMFVQKGARFEFLGADSRADFDYFEFPILFKVKFGATKAHAYLLAGPSVGFNMNAEGNVGIVSNAFEDRAESVEIAGELGVGGAYRLFPFVYLSGDIRYCHGLSNVLDESVAGINDWKSRDVRALIGFLFHLTE